MSISAETLKAHAQDPAVLCCRAEAGTVLTSANLEDPNIFPDLEDSGLLTIPDNVLKMGQVVGATLKVTTDSLIALTPDNVDVATLATLDSSADEEKSPETGNDGGVDASPPAAPVSVGTDADAIPARPEYLAHSVKHQHITIDKVEFGPVTKIEGTTLILRRPEPTEYNDRPEANGLIESLEVDIITPDRYGEYSDTIMDVQPIATKISGEVGSGVTRVIDGAIFMITGTDHNGVQVGEFGSCEGEMDRNIMWGRPGAPDKGEIFIKTKAVIKAKANMERPGPLAVHKVSDLLCEEIRQALKEVDASLITGVDEIKHFRRPGRPKVVIVKEIMGQGAMHDNLLLPVEPVGTLGAKPNVDLGNIPVMVSPVELLDGAIHALTCIGPASKETSRHYWREPLIKEALKDEEIDLAGVILVGSPQANSDKFYVAKRVGMIVEAMDVQGAVVTTEGFGNNHVDFAAHIEEIGKRGIKVVGGSYCSVQGTLVVGNEYMNAMCDNNKSMQGIENEILSNNTLCPEDAIRQLAMLKTLLGGGAVLAAERKWNPQIKEKNLKIIEKALGHKIVRELNEQSLPKSKKRLEKYEKE